MSPDVKDQMGRTIVGSAIIGHTRGSMSMDDDMDESPRCSTALAPVLNVAELGPPDAALVGAGWRLPAHTCGIPSCKICQYGGTPGGAKTAPL